MTRILGKPQDRDRRQPLAFTKGKRLHLTLEVLLLAAAGGLCLWVPSEPREPVYDGKPLTYWLGRILGSSRAISYNSLYGLSLPPNLTEPPPDEWVTQMLARPDSASVAFLTKELKRDSWFGAAWYRTWLWPKLPASMKGRLPAPFAGRVVVRQSAARLLGYLGPAAKPAIPALIRALNQDDDPEVRALAAWALGTFGKEARSATPALTRALHDNGAWVHTTAAVALSRIDPQAAAKEGIKLPSL